jgi:hypothetical protein
MSRDFSCATVPIGDATPDQIYQLAYYELAVFADIQETVQILPLPAPVLLDTPDYWMNRYLEKWFLPGVDDIFDVSVSPDEEAIREFVQRHETVWYVRSAERQPNEAVVFNIMSGSGYLPTVLPSNDPRYNQQLTIVRYEQIPDEWQNLHTFGDVIQLRSLEQDSPCGDNVTVKTWWTALRPLSENYGLNIQGNASDLTPVPTVFWEVGQFYFDERVVMLPCDTALTLLVFSDTETIDSYSWGQ